MAGETLRPEKPKTETVAKIWIHGDMLEITFPEKREDFWRVVKKRLNMSWSYECNCWRRQIDCIDRAAEAAHRILAAGFIVRIYDPEIQRKAIEADYIPEPTRWIYRRKSDAEYGGWFAINWRGYDDNLYNAARRIKRSRWSKPSVVVPPEIFEEVLDFAQMYNFQLSEGAQELIAQARQAKENALVVKVAPIVKPQLAAAEYGKPPVLDVPGKVEVDDEFKD